MVVAALSGAVSGVALLTDSFVVFHEFMHQHELWILALSAGLVVVGGWLEFDARRHAHNHGFPWLFVISGLCFFINLAIIAIHRA